MPRKQQLKRGSHERYHVPNLKRALEVFELLAKNPDGLTIPEIVKITHYSKSSTFRIVCTLKTAVVVNDARVVRMSRKLAALDTRLRRVQYCREEHGCNTKYARRPWRNRNARNHA
ncbi:MAG: helix-turn-helix domain-containing protein [Bacilli bacterium]